MQTVLISGSSRGLGRALAAEFAGRNYRTFGGIRQDCDLPENVRPVLLNVRDEDSAAAAAASVASYGPIDILINNAGYHVGGALAEIGQDDFKHVLDVNLLGAWRVTKAALPYMRDGGVIVMISSLSGVVGLPEDGVYTASKFALEGMSQSLAAELAPLGIRVIVIEPGAIATGFAGSTAGAQATDIASKVVDIIERPGNTLRYPVGDQAESVAAQLSIDRGEVAETLVTKLTGRGWQPSPSSEQ